MKTLYFDCFAGISGDMTLGALLDAGVSLDDLKAHLRTLPLSGWDITTERLSKHALAATKATVTTDESHAHRGLSDILKIIVAGDFDEEIKVSSMEAFTRLADVEAKIHSKTVDDVHFHEVGAVDAIIDIVGSMIGIHLLGIEKCYGSRVHVGTGFVRAAHGQIPLPAPATAAILRGVPTFSQGIESELTTPTGAAILTTLCDSFGPLPAMTTEAIGYGAGDRDLPIPNLLRVFVGEMIEDTTEYDTVELLEANIDDMNPEFFEFVFDRLFAAGALDVWLTPVLMKKTRPGFVLGVLCDHTKAGELSAIIFAETTTLGIRSVTTPRRKLRREIITVSTDYGDVRVKRARTDDRIVTIAPEYDDCKRLAAERNVPLRTVYDAARKQAEQE